MTTQSTLIIALEEARGEADRLKERIEELEAELKKSQEYSSWQE